MSYQEFPTIPLYERARFEDGKAVSAAPGFARWAADEPPPPIGAEIVVTINNCGPAIVTGYFVEAGWLGLRCRLTDAPEWHRKQNKNNPNGHVFGTEFRRVEPQTFGAGAILAASWGYDQTNVDFYRVEKVGGALVTLQPIEGNEASDGAMSLTGRVVPALPIRPKGEPIRRKLHVGQGEPFVRIESYSYARPWDGRPMHVSHDA